jgi:pyruvate/2-oxoglutarate dehydrogenase complex dihydrolipoamide dehydrogenase (E3) component
VEADTLCIGYGFVPSVELLRLAGCAFRYDEDLGGPVVVVDEWQRTGVDGVLAAGDGTGIGGSYVAEDEGRLAALGLAGDARLAAPVRRRLARKRAFAHALRRMHRIGAGIYELAAADTVVCRCEEVTLATLQRAIEASDDVNVVKGFTRAAMGLCQGRNCQRQIAEAIARRHGRDLGDVVIATPRSPVRPVPLAAIADAAVEDLGLFVAE